MKVETNRLFKFTKRSNMLSEAAKRAQANLICGSGKRAFFRFQVLLVNEISNLVRTLKFSFCGSTSEC